MKQLTTNLLTFNFKGVDLSAVSKVEFAFSQNVGESPLKVETYPGDNVTLVSDNSLAVHWTAAETAQFEACKPFYCDTRITLRETGYQPETAILKLLMKPTLFEEV